MTGYASAQSAAVPTPTQANLATPNQQSLGLEVRSVNSRFLDLVVRLPEDLRQHESALRELLTRRLKRGKVELRVSLERGTSSRLPEPSSAGLARLLDMQARVQDALPSARSLSVAEVFELLGNQEPAQAQGIADLNDLASRVIDDLMDARAKEGERLVHMLLGHLAQLRALATQAAPLVPRLVEQQRARFLERWREAMALGSQTAGANAPEAAHDRALTEATAFAIRIDVAEELTRLGSHLDEVERLLDKGGEVGKRLDFMIQEMQREANTLGSKSAMIELTRISVDMKVLIEQMREQVQNLE